MATTFVSEVPFEVERINAAAVYCSDGRYGDQFDQFLHEGLGLPRYDRIALPGGPACLCHIQAMRESSALERELKFLIEAHNLFTVILIAHQDCGFYKQVRVRQGSVEKQQFHDLGEAAAKIRTYHPDLIVESYFARRVEGLVRFEQVNAIDVT